MNRLTDFYIKLSNVVLVGLLKLFGSACRSEPAEILSKFDRFASYMLTAVTESDVGSSIIGVSVETVGFIASTESGKRALEQQGFVYQCLICDSTEYVFDK